MALAGARENGGFKCKSKFTKKYIILLSGMWETDEELQILNMPGFKVDWGDYKWEPLVLVGCTLRVRPEQGQEMNSFVHFWCGIL